MSGIELFRLRRKFIEELERYLEEHLSEKAKAPLGWGPEEDERENAKEENSVSRPEGGGPNLPSRAA